jgi:hypothetical protein
MDTGAETVDPGRVDVLDAAICRATKRSNGRSVRPVVKTDIERGLAAGSGAPVSSDLRSNMVAVMGYQVGRANWFMGIAQTPEYRYQLAATNFAL